MYTSHTGAWNHVQSVDESEDDEVQGILNKQATTTSPNNQNKHEYDDVVHRFSGLMIGQNIFAPPDQGMFMNSQLNANVASFTPNGTGQDDRQHWVENTRVNHRTPGPSGGPSPPNPFRYGLGGFQYRAGKSPPNFKGVESSNNNNNNSSDSGNFVQQQQQVFNNYGGGFSYETSAGNAWYEHLPNQNGVQQQQPNSGEFDDQKQKPLNFSFGVSDDVAGSTLNNFGGFNFQQKQKHDDFNHNHNNDNNQQYSLNQQYHPIQQQPRYSPQGGFFYDQQQQGPPPPPPPGGFDIPPGQQQYNPYEQQQQQINSKQVKSNNNNNHNRRPQNYAASVMNQPNNKNYQGKSRQINHNNRRRGGHHNDDEEERKDKRDSISNNNNNNNTNARNHRKSSTSFDSNKSSTTSSSSIGSRQIANSMDSQASREAYANKKRQDLEESPQTRSIFKEFYKNFRTKEKESFDEAFDYARQCLDSKDIPEKIHWKIYLEMADLAKRENRFADARSLYQLVNETQPYAHQGWLEYSKMEEECGRLHQCRMILHQGLEYCNYAEQLLTKAIKHEERMGNIQGARALLARLRNQSVDKTWRTILEGALLEGRAGNIIVARKVFKYLMQHVPWYGPIYFEATKFEEKNEEFDRAIAIVEKGLKEIPRYGPLWFNAFRLHEKTEMELCIREAKQSNRKQLVKPRLLREGLEKKINLFEMFGVQGDEFQITPLSCPLLKTRGALQRAMNCISKELVWKVHFEAAQVAERGGGKDALTKARQAYVQSILRCPVNLRWKVWLAGARAELSEGNMEKARQLLDRALNDVPAKSKAQVLLECSRLEEYSGSIDKARKILHRARLETKHEWKVFLESVMLEVRNGEREDAIRAAEDALAIHSGTGRLWAILVQLKHVHGPDAQRLVFREALKQVPKSGEVWCEGARVHMHPLSPHMDLDTAERYLEFAIQFTPQYGDSFIEALRWQLLYCNFFQGNALTTGEHEEINEQQFKQNMMNCDTSELELRCVNADPNYGALWFHCKRGPFDTARQVLRTAKKLLIAELVKFRSVYREGVLDSIRKKAQPKTKQNMRTTPALASGENKWLIDERMNRIPHAKEYVNFSTGLLSVNWLRENVNVLVDSERRKFLFGSDQIVP